MPKMIATTMGMTIRKRLWTLEIFELSTPLDAVARGQREPVATAVGLAHPERRSRPRRFTSTRTARWRSTRRTAAGPSSSAMRSTSRSGTLVRPRCRPGDPRGLVRRRRRRLDDAQIEATLTVVDLADVDTLPGGRQDREGVLQAHTVCRQRCRSATALMTGCPRMRSTRTSPVPPIGRTSSRVWLANRDRVSRSEPKIWIDTSARDPLMISLVRSSIGWETDTKVPARDFDGRLESP